MKWYFLVPFYEHKHEWFKYSPVGMHRMICSFYFTVNATVVFNPTGLIKYFM